MAEKSTNKQTQGKKWSIAELKDKIVQMEKVHNREKERLAKLLEESNIELAKCKAEVKRYKDGESLLMSEPHKVKSVLMCRARGDDVMLIKEKVEFKGIFMDIQEIEVICRNIDGLDIEYQNYYNKCAKEYENEIRLNPSILKQKNLENNLFTIDEAKKMISESVDSAEKEKKLLLLDKLLNTNIKILSDTVLSNDDGKNADTSINEMMEDYESQKDNIIQFDMSRVKKISNK